jgi:hypothetical protein
MVYSQEGVNIHVVNENDESIGGAVAYVLTLDSIFINSMVANEEGIVNIPRIDFQKEMLKIMAFGYNSFDIREASVNNTIKVKLIPFNIELSEIIVKANSNVIQKNDRIVFNVANEILTKGNNSYELIKFTPFIVVDNNDKISIIGKSGIQLYINGRKTNVPESSIQSYLASLPAEKIASIEVITNPGASIRTIENEGIINLILKKNETDGLNGTLTLSDSQRKKNSQDGSLYLNYQKNKFNVSANIYGDNTNFTGDQVSDYYYIASNNHQHSVSDEKTMYKELVGNIMADYNISDKQVVGLILNGSYNDVGGNTTGHTSFAERNAIQIDSVLYSGNQVKTPTQSYSVNFNYRLKVNEKGELSADADYLRNIREQYMQTNYARMENGTQLPPYEQFEQTSEDIMNSYSGKIEYKQTFNNTTNLTVGADAYSSSSTADFFHGDFQDGAYISDPQKTNIFLYKENYMRTYVSFSCAWTPKFNSRIEARLESVDSKGIQQVTLEEVKHNYLDLIPSVSLQYQFNPANRLSYSLNSFVARPGFYSLNPFRFYLSPSTYKEYNPALRPAKAFINAISYNLKGHYLFALNYMYIKDCTNNFLIPVDEQYTKYINANYGENQSVTFSFNWNQSLWKDRAYVNVSLSGMYMKNQGAVESIVIDAKGTSYNLFISGDVQLSPKYDWHLTSNFSYNSEMKLAHETSGNRYRFNIGMKKNFAYGISLNFGVNNLLFNNPNRYKVNDNYEYYLNPSSDSRCFYAGISIPFGNMKAKGAKGSNSSSSNVKNRLKE